MPELAPEIRFRPSPEVYAKAQQIADALGLTVTDVARMGLTQLARAREIPLAPRAEPAAVALRELPLYGTTVERVADIAAAAGRAAHAAHVKAGRLPPTPDDER